MKSEAEWKEETIAKIEKKKQSPFMDFVDCNAAWDNRHADEAVEALDRILQSVQPVDFGDQVQVNENAAFLRKFIGRTRK